MLQRITHTSLLNIKPSGEIQRIPAGDSLFLQISPKGKKTWYLRYDTVSAEGKRKQNIVSLGEFPALGLKEARTEADTRKNQARSGNANLAQAKKEELMAKAREGEVHTFKSVADDWIALRCAEWEARSGKQNRGRLAANVYPIIGDQAIETVTVGDVESCLNNIIARDSKEVARRVHSLVVGVFKYALAKGLIQEPDIIVRLSWYKEQMPKRRRQSLYAEELTPEDVGRLLLAVDAAKDRWSVPVSVALRLAPYVAVRPAELLEARWTEFDFAAAEWIIPAERMKMKKAHLVPLSRQAVELLRRMREFSGPAPFVFPSSSSRGNGRPVSSMALIQALRRMGFTAENDKKFVTHGFRGLFSTTAYNVLGASTLVVELQLAHSEKDKIKAAYHKTSLRTALDERRALLQRYADYLDELREKSRTFPRHTSIRPQPCRDRRLSQG